MLGSSLSEATGTAPVTKIASQCASQKGGSGKTSLAAHLAVEAERVGDAPAWLIDTDKQATLSLWHERRKHDTPQRAEVSFARLAAGLTSLAERDAVYCFIDTPPTISDQSVVALDLADLVLIPVRPSPADLWAVSETVALVKTQKSPFCSSLPKPKPRRASSHRRLRRFPSMVASRKLLSLTEYLMPWL
jgi:chromosome partitioning protein